MECVKKKMCMIYMMHDDMYMMIKRRVLRVGCTMWCRGRSGASTLCHSLVPGRSMLRFAPRIVRDRTDGAYTAAGADSAPYRARPTGSV